MKTKICCDCLQEKPLTEFYPNSNNGLFRYCKKCNSIRGKKWRKDNYVRHAKMRKEWRKRKPIDDLYTNYKTQSKQRKRIFELTKDEFALILKQPCYYCGGEPNPINGVDRIDSSKGYLKDNVLPCCTKCNRMKSDLEIEEFYEKCKIITEINQRRLTMF